MARIKHGTLVADTVTAVPIDENSGTVEVMIVASPSPIYFRVDGTDPEIEGDDNEVVPAGIGAAIVVDLPDVFDIRLKSAGTPKYSVKGA